MWHEAGHNQHCINLLEIIAYLGDMAIRIVHLNIEGNVVLYSDPLRINTLQAFDEGRRDWNASGKLISLLTFNILGLCVLWKAIFISKYYSIILSTSPRMATVDGKFLLLI